MNIFTSFEIALNSLTHNKLRSALTMMGIIMGAGVLIAMLSMGAGAKKQVEEQNVKMGINRLVIFPERNKERGVKGGMGSMPVLTDEDAEAIMKECPAVAVASPAVRVTKQAVCGNKNWSADIYGVNRGFLEIRQWELEKGFPFTEEDVLSASKVCLLGKAIAERLFNYDDPIGKTIRIDRIPFIVLGVLEEKGVDDNCVIMPYTTVLRRIFRIKSNSIHFIPVKAIDSRRMKNAQQQITDLLRQRHNILQGEQNDFHIWDMTEPLRAAQAIVRTITILLGCIASISLVIGGIGIMNIMLVSVNERTREIGLRMAIGAKRKDILFQFATEALVLSLSGGLIGIVIGIAASFVIGNIAKWAIIVNIGSVFLAFFFAVVIGIFFGYYPALRAAKLNPIEALRYK